MNTPGDAESVYWIRQPGSYYLTGSVVASAGKSAIAVDSTTAGQVAIDLCGFELRGAGASSSFGVATGSGSSVWIHDGSIRDFGDSAVHARGQGVLIERVQVRDCGAANIIYASGAGVVRDCTVQGGSFTGFYLDGKFTIERCTATQVDGYGFILVGESVISDCAAVECTNIGISTGDNAIVQRCRTVRNTVIGIMVGNGCTVTESISEGNNVGVSGGIAATCVDVVCRNNSGGFQLAARSNLRGCSALTNSLIGFSLGDDSMLTACQAIGNMSKGFSATNRTAFVDCVASKTSSGSGFVVSDSNTFDGCRADENTGDGFNGRFGNAWRGCSARANTSDGIEGSSATTVLSCNLDSNGNGANVGANIRLTGDASRVEGNSLVGADFGIQTTGGGNLIVRNSSRNSANSYGGIAGGNDVGPIGSAATSASPWANILY